MQLNKHKIWKRKQSTTLDSDQSQVHWLSHQYLINVLKMATRMWNEHIEGSINYDKYIWSNLTFISFKLSRSSFESFRTFIRFNRSTKTLHCSTRCSMATNEYEDKRSSNLWTPHIVANSGACSSRQLQYSMMIWCSSAAATKQFFVGCCSSWPMVNVRSETCCEILQVGHAADIFSANEPSKSRGRTDLVAVGCLDKPFDFVWTWFVDLFLGLFFVSL